MEQAPGLDQEELIRLVYPQLREMARRLLRHERPNHTLQPTALAHEAFLKLFGKRPDQTVNTGTFLAFAAHQMRQILIDHGRKHSAKKRGGDFAKVPIFDADHAVTSDLDGLLAIDAALEKLGRIDPRGLEVVELKFFAGFNNAEAAEVMGVSTATVESAWHHARLWLFRELASKRG
jgi:RNA polymerase sigma factor (TIGR02999 family)